MSAVAEKIIERVHALPPDRQEEVLRFVESLASSTRKASARRNQRDLSRRSRI